MSKNSHNLSSRQAAQADLSFPVFSVRRILGQTFMAFSLLLTLAVYNVANPQNSAPANSNSPSIMLRDFE